MVSVLSYDYEYLYYVWYYAHFLATCPFSCNIVIIFLNLICETICPQFSSFFVQQVWNNEKHFWLWCTFSMLFNASYNLCQNFFLFTFQSAFFLSGKLLLPAFWSPQYFMLHLSYLIALSFAPVHNLKICQCSKIWCCNINSLSWTWLYCGGDNYFSSSLCWAAPKGESWGCNLHDIGISYTFLILTLFLYLFEHL